MNMLTKQTVPDLFMKPEKPQNTNSDDSQWKVSAATPRQAAAALDTETREPRSFIFSLTPPKDNWGERCRSIFCVREV